MFDVESQRNSRGSKAQHPGLHGISQQTVRTDFIRKVYAIVAAQVCFTAFVAICCTHGPMAQPIMSWVSGHPAMYKWGTLIATMASMFALMANQKNHPLNLYLLGLFTLILSLNVGVICAMVSSIGLGHLVIQAAAITGALFMGLTIYTFTSKRDFSWMGAMLFPLLFALSLYGFAAMFFPSLRCGVMALVYPCFGALLFCAYIVYDTFMIIEKMGPDDYVAGAIQLYLDIINLFLYILQILLEMSKKNNN